MFVLAVHIHHLIAMNYTQLANTVHCQEIRGTLLAKLGSGWEGLVAHLLSPLTA